MGFLVNVIVEYAEDAKVRVHTNVHRISLGECPVYDNIN